MILIFLFVSHAVCALFHKEEVIKDFYTVEWGAQNGEIEFRCTVKATGWVGIGFTPSGAMPNADIVTGWINSNGSVVVSDRHVGDTPGLPIEDKSQDLTNFNVTEQDGFTVLQFTRKLVACDVDDVTIAGTSRVLFAFGRQKPENNVPAKHQSSDRVVKSMDLVNAKLPDAPTETDLASFDLKFDNAVIPAGEQTLYFHRAMQLPVTAHVVSWDLIIPDSERAFVHHILVFICPLVLSAKDLAFAGDAANEPENVRKCNSAKVLIGWAVGGKGFNYPPNVGYPIDESMQVMMEIHINNVPKTKQNLNSGIRFFYTKQLRPIEAGILELGHQSDTWLNAMPCTVSKRSSYCISDCTSKLPATGVTVFATMLHAHTAGIKLKTRHILANGTEIEPLAQNDFYDFNLQSQIFLEKPRLIMPGDQFITECTYATPTRPRVTVGGISTDDEMCLNYVSYYPATPALSQCMSSMDDATAFPSMQEFDAFGAGYKIKKNQDVADYLKRVQTWDLYESAYNKMIGSGRKVVSPHCNDAKKALLKLEPVAAIEPKQPYVEPNKCASVAAKDAAPFKADPSCKFVPAFPQSSVARLTLTALTLIVVFFVLM